MSHVIHAKIQRWGNGLGLRVAGPMRDIPHFSPDTEVEVEIFEDGFRVKRASPTLPVFPYSEQELLEGLSPATAHHELIALPSASETDY
ncbi:MAG: hypothetical protein LAT66_01185 [Alkalimonas sp.]|nr:hypothetical protein [Alkalimonas sp.]